MINNMNTRFRFNRCFLLACLSVLAVSGAMTGKAQGAGRSDSLNVPGNLFPTTRITTTGAVSATGGETLYQTPVPNLTNTLSGRLPGLFVSQQGGLPYWDIATMRIRGLGTYSGAGLKIYVDGFEVLSDYLQYLSPAEIESFSILKDAASLSTFGMEGANGVVWIETKRGEQGRPVVEVQFRTGIQNAINILKPLNATDFETLRNQALSNDNGRVRMTDPDRGYIANPGAGANTDWYREAMRRNGRYSDADVSFHGGDEAARYHVVLGYADQQGLLNTRNTDQTSNTRFTRFNARANLDLDLFRILHASFNLGGRLEDWNRPNYDVVGLMNDLARYPQNIYPVFDSKQEVDPVGYSGTELYPNNPVGSISGLGRQNSRLRILQGNFKFREDLDFLLEGLYLQQSLSFYVQSQTGFGKTKNYARYYDGETTTPDQTTAITAGALGTRGMEEWKQGAFSAGYDNTFGAHKLSSALNFMISDRKSNGLFGYIHSGGQ